MTCGTTVACTELLLQILVIGISNGAVLALNAVGVTLVYGAVRMINFAYGDIFALTTVLVVVFGAASPPQNLLLWAAYGGFAAVCGPQQ